jgi:acetyl esterase/lipase
MLKWMAIVVAVLAGGTYAAFQLSPWPGALLIRMAFDKDTIRISEALARHVPDGVSSTLNEPYDAAGDDGFLDVFRPEGATGPLPAVVWVHGGAYVYGRRDNIANYLKILASKGYATVAVGYSKAPGATYPQPVMEVNRALDHLKTNAERLGIDPQRIVLAGDSAGAQIAAQLALAITSPDYAVRIGVAPAITPNQLRGVLLNCGPYGTDSINFDGPFGGFLDTVLWSYFGTHDYLNDPRLKDFAITANLTKDFPPFFISVGNGDPLKPLSYDLKARADALGIANDALFFPDDRQPPLPHEYQFNLDDEAGREALERMVAFIANRTQ